MSDSEKPDRDNYDVYVLRGVTYVPHYSLAGVYVGPGSWEYTAEWLLQHGAEKKREYILKRSWS